MKLPIQWQYLAMILYTTFSGAARKWYFHNQALKNGVFIIQLLLPLILLFYINRRLDCHTHLKYAGTGYLMLLVALAFHPLQSSWLHGFAGILVHSLFWIILFAYFLYQDEIHLDRYRLCFVLIVVIETFLGAFQYTAASDSLINQYASLSDEQNTAIAGNAVRVTGTFSYLGGFGAFSHFMLCIICYYLRSNRGHWLLPLLLLMGLYNCLISGSRGVFIFFVLTLTIFIVSEVPFSLSRNKVISLLGLTILFFLLNIAFHDPFHLHEAFNKSYQNFSERALTNTSEGLSRITGDVTDPFSKDFAYKLAGIGLGTTYQGANTVFGTSPLLQGTVYEGELFRLVIEGGYPLLIARFLMLGYVLSRFRFSMFFKAYLFLIMGFFTSFIFNSYNSIYLPVGLILLNHAYSPYSQKHAA